VTENARDEIWAALRGCRTWAVASDAAVSRLAEHGTAEGFAPGELLVSEGAAASRFGVIASGRARVFHLAADGRRTIFEELGENETFGLVAALAAGRSPATVEAASHVHVVWVPGEALVQLAEEDAGIARALLQDLAGRVLDFTSMVQTLSLDVPARVASYLFQRSLASGETTPEGLEVGLGMRKADLAEALGTVPETLSRAFARLRDDGIADVRGSTVLVHDVGALARLGSGYREG
jgi:CRP/FNR family transcriptional regulator